ncbi:hypothetical protein [Sandarakinorhabdus sp. DWP1-3-1]|uniref:hypothetical protein n=1 Tax=Sandarakinorhabdus sp. DWP1-3-1 TaxID=2804627 RepID=UPI003CE9E15F
MHNPRAMKMEQFTRFDPDERERRDAPVTGRRRSHSVGDDIIADGAHAAVCRALLSGRRRPAVTASAERFGAAGRK